MWEALVWKKVFNIHCRSQKEMVLELFGMSLDILLQIIMVCQSHGYIYVYHIWTAQPTPLMPTLLCLTLFPCTQYTEFTFDTCMCSQCWYDYSGWQCSFEKSKAWWSCCTCQHSCCRRVNSYITALASTIFHEICWGITIPCICAPINSKYSPISAWKDTEKFRRNIDWCRPR